MPNSLTMSSILGGTRLTSRKAGEVITNEAILDCYYFTTGAQGIVQRIINAKWSNGFTETLNITEDRKLVLQEWDQWCYVFGYSALVVKGQDIEAWNPKTNGTGFVIVGWDDKNRASRIEIYSDGMKVNEVEAGNGGDGFYIMRARAGLPGPRGLSIFHSLIDVMNPQHDIFVEFLAYARIHGYTHKVLKIGTAPGSTLDAALHDAYYARFKTTEKEGLVLISSNDSFEYASPTAGQYDPVKLMEFGDNLIARDSQLTRMQLTGNPQGHLSSSQDASAGFFANIKGEQVYTMNQVLPVLKIFGATDAIKFNEPEEVTMESQMTAVKLIRDSLSGLIEDEDIVAMINEYLGYVGEDALRLKKKEPIPDLQTNPNGEQNVSRPNEGQDGSSPQSGDQPSN